MPFSLFQGKNRQNGSTKGITIVSGLPRSGTSMMMKMLEAGGILPLTDNIRVSDEDNPKGYYEFERVKKMKDGDKNWLQDAHGKSVKVISALLEQLPETYDYKVIFMLRNMDEILASQRAMLIRNGEDPDKVPDETLAQLYQQHLARIKTWLERQPNMDVLYVHYNDVMKDPVRKAREINQFLGGTLYEAKMTEVADRNLYRNRQTSPQKS